MFVSIQKEQFILQNEHTQRVTGHPVYTRLLEEQHQRVEYCDSKLKRT